MECKNCCFHDKSYSSIADIWILLMYSQSPCKIKINLNEKLIKKAMM